MAFFETIFCALLKNFSKIDLFSLKSHTYHHYVIFFYINIVTCVSYIIQYCTLTIVICTCYILFPGQRYDCKLYKAEKDKVKLHYFSACCKSQLTSAEISTFYTRKYYPSRFANFTATSLSHAMFEFLKRASV